VLAKFRAIGPKPGNLIPLPGYIEFLSLTKEQQYARYEEELKNRISADPTDPDLKVRYLGLLIGQGKAHEAASFANGIPADALPGPLAADAGHSLLQAEEYAAAMPFLERAASTLKTNESEIDLAIATMRTTGAQQSLVYLNGLSETARNGDYYLVKAEALEDLGKNEDAFTAIQQAVERAPARAELYKQAVLFLATNGESERATKLSAAAMRADPNAPDILLLRAAMLANSHETETAEHLLKEIENRWPEWAPAYISYGAVLDSQRRTQEAQMQLATAVALGATSTDVYFFFPKSQFMRSR
jgi:tetratricopeptide (TPR) repeat protein